MGVFCDAEKRQMVPLEGGTLVALDWARYGKEHASIRFLLSHHGGMQLRFIKLQPAARKLPTLK